MKKRTIVIVVVSTIAILILSPILYQVICWQIYLIDPNIVRHKEEAYRKLSSEELIKKLDFWNIWWFDRALNTLAERKEKSAVPHIIKLLNSSYKYKRDSAMRTLAKIGDTRAIVPLMEVIKKGEKNPDYYMALSTLSEMKYEGVFPYVIKWAQKDDAHRNGSIYMLESFGKQECIPLLENIREKVRRDDPGFEFRIDEAIQHIQAHQR